MEKARGRLRHVRMRETNASEPLLKHRNRIRWHQNQGLSDALGSAWRQQKIAHLRRHHAEPDAGPENDSVVIGQLLHGRDRCSLIDLKAGLFSNIFVHQFGNTLDVRLRTRLARSGRAAR
jgi:hypothetical protein